MTQELRLMIGIPGAGKSTWIKQEVQRLEEEHKTTCVISRDYVRFSMLKPGEDYFAHENDVFNEFIRQINEAMELGIDEVFVDATHVSEASRKKVLNRLRPDSHTNLQFIEIECPVDVALARNAKREGLARVPDSAIINMEKSRTDPMKDTHPDNKYGFRDIYYTKITYEGE